MAARPPLSFIEAGGFLEYHCVGNKAAKNADELTSKLSNTTGETKTLYASDRATVIDRVTFPATRRARLLGGRHFIRGCRMAAPTSSGSARAKLTPEASNFLPITNVVVNEHFRTTIHRSRTRLSLYNPTANDVEYQLLVLSNRPETPQKFQIPASTILTAPELSSFLRASGQSASAA